MSAAALLGLLGVALYLGSYAALQFGLLRGQSYSYAGINLAAASCVLLSLTEEFNLSSALIQVSWITISLVGMIRLYLLHRTELSDEDEALVRALLPDAERAVRLRLLQLGNWSEHPVGEQLVEEGSPVNCLDFIAHGLVQVTRSGEALARLGPGALIGEMTYHNGGPATADIEVLQPVTLFRLDAARLRDVQRTDPTLAAALELTVAGELRAKLAEASAHIVRNGQTCVSNQD